MAETDARTSARPFLLTARGFALASVAVVVGVVFVYSFVQASLGEGSTLNLHIPGALIIVGATVWLTAWLFSPSVHDGGR